MGTGFLVQRGGSGGIGGLNFKVVGNPKPTNPKENTIWVDTDKINNYYFSVEQPENMVDYDVWFPTSESSTVAFNALKKNGIQVYPISAKQYVSGACVDKTAKSYQGGKWVDWWNGELFDNGNGYDGVTGGWEAYALKINGNVTESQHAPTITTLDDGSMKLTYGVATTGNGYQGGIVRTKNKINLSGYTKLRFTGYLYDKNASNYMRLCIWSGIGTTWTTNIVASISGSASKNIVTFPDVELSGLPDECYIGFGIYMITSGSEVLVQELRLIK